MALALALASLYTYESDAEELVDTKPRMLHLAARGRDVVAIWITTVATPTAICRVWSETTEPRLLPVGSMPLVKIDSCPDCGFVHRCHISRLQGGDE
jgi:hypothetical protein